MASTPIRLVEQTSGRRAIARRVDDERQVVRVREDDVADVGAHQGRGPRDDYRTEVLNAHLFESIAELRAMTDTWGPWQPRPGAAAHVFAEAFLSGTVYLSAVYLTRLSQAVLAISICEHGCSTADRNRPLLPRRDAPFLQRSDPTLHGFAEVHALQFKLCRRCGMRTMKTIVASITALLMAASPLGQPKKDDEPQSGVDGRRLIT